MELYSEYVDKINEIYYWNSILTLLALTRLIPGLNTTLFAQAFFAFILLPAPYILPLYIPDKKKADILTKLLVYSTTVSLIGYGILIGLSFDETKAVFRESV